MTAGLYKLLESQSRKLALDPDSSLSERRQFNVQERHYKRLLTELVAPLPAALHEMIRKKASGEWENPLVALPRYRPLLYPPPHPKHYKAVSNYERALIDAAKERRRQRRWYGRLLAQLPLLVEEEVIAATYDDKPAPSPLAQVHVKRDPLAGKGPRPAVTAHDKADMTEEQLQASLQLSTKKRSKKSFTKGEIQ